MKRIRRVVWCLPALVAFMAVGLAAEPAPNAPAKYCQAYFLEQEKQDFAQASRLYAEVAATPAVSAEWKAKAKARVAICREEAAADDLAGLMPPAPLGYLEMVKPGEHLRSFLDKLGLLAKEGAVVAPGPTRLAISPALVGRLFGVRGLAVALTGLDPKTLQPSWVAVCHPGEIALARELVESFLPVMAPPAKTVRGYAVYQIKGVCVALTARLIVAGSSLPEVEGVLGRLQDPKAASLGTDAQVDDLFKGHANDLLFGYVNLKPFLPMLEPAVAAMARQTPVLGMVIPMLDLKSLNALSYRAYLGGDEVRSELVLRLDEGHQNQILKFLQRQPIDKEALRAVPEGVAGALALALKEPPAKAGAAAASPQTPSPLDSGRKFLSGLEGAALFALSPAPGKAETERMPDIVAVFTVKDPAAVQAAWFPMIGMASAAAGGTSAEGVAVDVDGVPARIFSFDKVKVYIAVSGNRLLAAASENALKRTLAAHRSGRSLVDDPAFASSLERLGPHTTTALFLSASRIVELAQYFMPKAEAAELSPFLGLLAKLMAVYTVDVSDRALKLTSSLSGFPDVSALVNGMIAEEQAKDQAEAAFDDAVNAGRWDEALGLLDKRLASKPRDSDALRKKFDLLALEKQDMAAATAAAEALGAAMWEEALPLNNFAWALLTEERYAKGFNAVALRLARRANELTEQARWAFLDTQALAEFETGNAAGAAELEEKAIARYLAQNESLTDLQKSLQRFKGEK